MTHAEAGAYFKTTRMTWFRWESGAMIPSPPHMVALFCAGVATPNDFYDLPVAMPQSKAA